MNFAWAMDMVLNKERAVRRESWTKNEYILKSECIEYYMRGNPMRWAWYPSQADMLAEDWVEVLEVKNEEHSTYGKFD